MYTTIITGLAEGIFTVTINRPEKLNALNRTVVKELGMAVDEIYSNAAIKGAMITGSGNKAFVAGADIPGFAGLDPASAETLAKEGLDIFFRIENAPKPIVAAVNGYALGGGCELALACHFRLCSDNAIFGQPETGLGIVPGYGATQRLPKIIGSGRAMEVILSGNMISAPLALQYGLVNYVTTPETLLEKTAVILKTIASKAPVAVAKSIQAVNAAFTANGFAVETKAFADSFATKDLKEGVAAFTDKRKPVFTGH